LNSEVRHQTEKIFVALGRKVRRAIVLGASKAKKKGAFLRVAYLCKI